MLIKDLMKVTATPKSKYKNKKCSAFGLNFDSIGEKDRYLFLLNAEKQKQIEYLKCQVPYLMEINGHKICKYIADFVYSKNGVTVVEDFKGFKTSVYVIKEKLMLACYGITIRCVKNPTESI